MATFTHRPVVFSTQYILDHVRVRLIVFDDADERERYNTLMKNHHYLKNDTLVGEQLRYVAEIDGKWLALLSWSAAAYHLIDRENWIAWDSAQRRRRLSLVANNARFLILPKVDCPNLASRVLALCCQQLSNDWQQTYKHPILVVESFVDSQLFRGTSYKAQGWELLGQTKGYGRARQDYYTPHHRPKQLWVRELCSNACATLRAAQLPDELQHIENAIIPRTELKKNEMQNLWNLCRQVPDWRAKKGKDYSLQCLLTIMIMAAIAGVTRGQRDLAAFAQGLTQQQLRTLGSYRKRNGKYDYPKETTFQRILAKLDAEAFERILIQWQLQRAGQSNDDQIGIDGKAQRGSAPHLKNEQKPQLVSAQSLPSGQVLGTVAVAEKSNEIPAARALLEKLGPLDNKLLMLDALHSCQQTMRQAYQDHGADFLIPVKKNHPELLARAVNCLPDRTPAVISPLSTKQGIDHAHTPAVRYRRKRR